MNNTTQSFFLIFASDSLCCLIFAQVPLLQVILPIFIFCSLFSPTHPNHIDWLTKLSMARVEETPLGVSHWLPHQAFIQKSWQLYYSAASSSTQNNYSCHLVSFRLFPVLSHLWSHHTKHLSQVDQGPNNICHGMPYKTVKGWMNFLKDYMNDLGLTWERDTLSGILPIPMIVFKLYQEMMNIHSGILDVGYVYHSNIEERYLMVY